MSVSTRSINNTTTMANNNMMIPNKDPVKIVYLDVSFQGQDGGRLALRSRSMTFFAANGERQGNIAWNAIAKVQTGAVKNATEEKYMLKILNNAHQSLTFQMKDEQDLDRIRNDIQDSIQAFRRENGEVKSAPTAVAAAGSASVAGSENSLTCFPRFVDDSEVGSTRSAISHRTSGSGSGSGSANGIVLSDGSVVPAAESTRSVTTRNMMMQSTRSLGGTSSRNNSTFRDEDVQSLAYSQRQMPMKGEIVMEEDVDASTIASTVASERSSNNNNNHSLREIDPEAATTYSNGKGSIVEGQPTKMFREEDYAMPVASFRLVPDGNETYYHPRGDSLMIGDPPQKRAKKICRSKWFWLALLLILLLLIGIAIGMPLGVFSSKNNNDSNDDNKTNQVIGLEDTTTINSTQTVEDDSDSGPIEIASPALTSSPSKEPTTVAPTTSTIPSFAPTSAPVTMAPTVRNTECDHVGHDQPMNNRAVAVNAGRFGGSSYCRANIVSLCEWTKWVPFNTYQGVGNAWFKATALEDSFCVADIEHQIQLHVPEGVDYDLHVYHTSTDTPHDSSTVSGSNGNIEAVIISGNDGHLSDQSFLYYIQVEFKSGSSCEPWTLTLYGHQCL